MHLTRTSVSKTLSERTMERDLLVYRVNSMNDHDFTKEMNNNVDLANTIRIAILHAGIREDNIKSYRATGRLNATTKEVTCLMKLGDHQKLTHYIHSLDDTSLKALSNDPSIKELIEHDDALSQRYVSIMSTPVNEIQITGNVKHDTEMLLAMSQKQIDKYFDANVYNQDSVIDEIKTIIASSEYIRRRTIIDNEYTYSNHRLH